MVAVVAVVVVVQAPVGLFTTVGRNNCNYCSTGYTSVSAFVVLLPGTIHSRRRNKKTIPLIPPLQMSLASNRDRNNQVNDGYNNQNDLTSDVTKISIPVTTSRNEFHQKHYKVVIVGAGASGLQCCNTLMKQYNISVQDILILEARPRIGGRIYTTFETAIVVNDQLVENSQDPVSSTAATTTTTFALDHGAAWVHGTGFDIGTVIPETIDEEVQLEECDENIHTINPMMYLLEKHASMIRQTQMNETETSGPEEKNYDSEYERRFYINPIVSGNPWMRPRSVLHDDGQLGLFVAGRYMFGNVSNSSNTNNTNGMNGDVSVLLRQALQRHYSILRQVQTIGNDMYDAGRGLETTTTSLADSIQMALTQLHGNLSDDADVAAEPLKGSDEQQTIAAITPFYMLLLECWYGCEVSGMQLSEFIEDKVRMLDYEDHTYHKEGDFAGPHCSLQNGMISVLQPLLQNGVKEQILCNEEVIKIQYGQDHDSTTASKNSNTNITNFISVETASGLQVTSETCVVTVPAGCLKHAVVNETVFVGTPLSPDKVECISLLQMGSYKKIFLTFDRIFWPKEPAFIGLIRHTDNIENDRNDNKNEMYYKLKSTHPLGNCILVDNLWARRNIASMEIVLFGLAGRWSTGKSDEELRDAVLAFLSDSMNIPMLQLQEYYVSCHVTRWEEDKYSRGAYSSTALGILPRHLQEFRRPEWDDRLVFSGEATISEYDGSVFAALYSGMNAAKCVQNYFSKSGKTI